jgi:Family of unknown function (DUF5662)
MLAYLHYIRTVFRHKWFVFVAGRRVGVSVWRLLIHDWSKFTPAELGPYVRRFGRGSAGSMQDKELDAQEFRYAFLHHVHHNPHHWEHWVLKKPQPIPDKFVKEMVADWMGAGRAYVGHWEVAEWYENNKDKINLHDSTRRQVEALVSKHG